MATCSKWAGYCIFQTAWHSGCLPLTYNKYRSAFLLRNRLLFGAAETPGEKKLKQYSVVPFYYIFRYQQMETKMTLTPRCKRHFSVSKSWLITSWFNVVCCFIDHHFRSLILWMSWCEFQPWVFTALWPLCVFGLNAIYQTNWCLTDSMSHAMSDEIINLWDLLENWVTASVVCEFKKPALLTSKLFRFGTTSIMCFEHHAISNLVAWLQMQTLFMC